MNSAIKGWLPMKPLSMSRTCVWWTGVGDGVGVAHGARGTGAESGTDLTIALST